MTDTERHMLQTEIDRLSRELARLEATARGVTADRDRLRQALQTLIDRARPVPHDGEPWLAPAAVGLYPTRAEWEFCIAALQGHEPT